MSGPTGRPPMWASRLLTEVWQAEGTGAVPRLGWWRTDHFGTSGRCWGTDVPRIHISAGTGWRQVMWRESRARYRQAAQHEQRIVLLHEIAHALCFVRGIGHHHDATFWLVAWSLYIRYRGSVPLSAVLEREDKAGSVQIAASLNVRGAQALADARGRRSRKEPPQMATTTKGRRAKAATTEAPATKQCPGVPALAAEYPPHQAPLDAFVKNAAQKDGLSRKCRTCWQAYTAYLKARRSSEAPAQVLADGAVLAEAAAESAAEAATTPDSVAVADAPAEPQPEAPVPGEAAQRRRLAQHERALAKAGGAGSEAGQVLLAQWAAEDQQARREAQRLVKHAERHGIEAGREATTESISSLLVMPRTPRRRK